MNLPKLGVLSPDEAAAAKTRLLEDTRKTIQAASLTPVSDWACEGYDGRTEAVLRQQMLTELADPESWALYDRVLLHCFVCNTRETLAEGLPMRDPAAVRAFLLEMAEDHPISPCPECGTVPTLVIDRTLDGPSFRVSVGWEDLPDWWEAMYGGEK